MWCREATQPSLSPVAATQPEETWSLFNRVTLAVNQPALHRMQFMALNLQLAKP